MNDFKELAETLLRAQAALDAQASSQPEIDRLTATLCDKLDYITRLEADILDFKRMDADKQEVISNLTDELALIRKERDDHGLEALALREELDKLKSNIDNAIGCAVEKFYTTMQVTMPAITAPSMIGGHVHEPVKVDEPKPTSFDEPEPSYGNVMAWSAWNKARVEWNNIGVGHTVYSNNTNRNFSYD